MRVLHVVLEVSEQEFPYNELCVALSDRYRIAVCTYFKRKTSIHPAVALFEGNGTLRSFVQALESAFESESFDIVHVHSPHVGIVVLIRSLLKGSRCDRYVYTVHHSYTNSNLKLRNRLLSLPIFAFYAAIVFVSNASLSSFPAAYRWVAGSRSHVVPNGVDVARVDRVLAGLTPDVRASTFTVVSVGRLIPIKNPVVLVKAFQMGVDAPARLLLVGSGELKSALHSLGESLGIGKLLELRGEIQRDRVYRAFAESDVFVSLSRGEGLPVTVLEAMACRCPVILSDIAPHREIAQGADFIPLLQPDDLTGLAFQLARYRAMSPSERAEIGNRCRALVLRHFALSETHWRYERVYLELTREKKTRLDITARASA